jgi:hypothetical protein
VFAGDIHDFSIRPDGRHVAERLEGNHDYRIEYSTQDSQFQELRHGISKNSAFALSFQRNRCSYIYIDRTVSGEHTGIVCVCKT